MKKLFLAWQDPHSRRWFPVGRLTLNNGSYQFVYTCGAREAQEKCNFQPISMFPRLDRPYESEELFPLFANRVPSRSRLDYGQYVEWLNLPEHESDPLAILLRSGGRRATDTFEVFPCPEPDENGLYRVHFFVHGMNHLSSESITRISQLVPGERLLLLWDFQNPYDPSALMLRTNDKSPGDGYRHIVGYCPAYLLPDIFDVLGNCDEYPKVCVERTNPPPAPLQFKLLCNLTACWPAGFRPFSDKIYQPIVGDAPNSFPQP